MRKNAEVPMKTWTMAITKLGDYTPDTASLYARRALAEFKPSTIYTSATISRDRAVRLASRAAVDKHHIDSTLAMREITVDGHAARVKIREQSLAELAAEGIYPELDGAYAEPILDVSEDDAKIGKAVAQYNTRQQMRRDEKPDADLALAILRERERLGSRGAGRLAAMPGVILGTMGMLGVLTTISGEVFTFNEPTTQTVPVTRTVDSYLQGGATNPIATGVVETPQEMQRNITQDRQAIRRTLQYFHDNGGRLTKVIVTGHASPDTADPNQNLTQGSIGNDLIAQARGADGLEADLQEAHAQHVPLTRSQISSTGEDVVLKGEPLKTLNNDVRGLRKHFKKFKELSLNGLVALYSGTHRNELPAGVVSDLDKSFKDQRGESTKIFGTIEKKGVKDNVIYKLEKLNTDATPFEIVMTFVGVMYTLFSMGELTNTMTGRLARKRAKLLLEHPDWTEDKVGVKPKKERRWFRPNSTANEGVREAA